MRYDSYDDRKGDWMQAVYGGRFYPIDPRSTDFEIEKIAAVLSVTNRWQGAIDFHYSVAQHSVLVMDNCPPPYKMQALLHDAHEMIVCDLPRPLKRSMPVEVRSWWDHMVGQIDAAIFKRFDVKVSEWSDQVVKDADNLILATEANYLIEHPDPDMIAWLRMARKLDMTLKPWPANVAKAEFLKSYYQLIKKGEEP